MRRRYKITLRPGERARIGPYGGVEKWQSHSSQATKDYERGIKNPRRPWGKSTCEAHDRYKAGVDKAHSRGAFTKGVKRRGFAGWRNRTLRKGPTRFSEGVAGAGDDYARGYEPYHALIPSIFLPRRYPRGDPRNIDRVKVICNEFGRLKVGKAPTGKTVCPED